MRTQLWWASVGGNKTEPVRVVKEGGRRIFYSIGCGDPHELDGVELLEKITDMPLSKRSRAASEAANARWSAYYEANRQYLGYRRF
jgi:hypothetical protein